MLGIGTYWDGEGRGPAYMYQKGASTDTRFCSIQVILIQRGDQPDIAFNFRGNFKIINTKENITYANGF